MGLGWGEFIGVTGDNAPHSHHAVQVLLSDVPQPLWTAATGWKNLRGAVIGPESPHQLGSNGQPVRLLYVEPHSDAGRRLMAGLADGLRVLLPEELEAARLASNTGVEPDEALAEMLSPSSTGPSGSKGDEDIEAWITALPVSPPEHLTAAACARQMGLSSSRFLHRFRAHTGLPLRPYLRWRRLLVALRAAMQGASLTDAAHAAGFSDAAHFTRTFRRHFGVPPSALMGTTAQP